MARTLLTGALLLVLIGCEGATGRYPMPTEPPHTWEHSPVDVGDPAWAVVLYIELRPGDRIELIDAEPVRLADGVRAEFFVSRPVVKDNGDRVIGEQREPLAGAEIVGPGPGSAEPGADFTVGILAELTASAPGRYVLESVRLRYRLNGGPEQVGEGIDTVLVVCADRPAPDTCEDLESG